MKLATAIGIAIIFALAVPATAGASTIATGKLRAAIEKAAAPQTPSGAPQRCLLVRVTTKGGGDWATVGWTAGGDPGLCNHYGFNGVSVVHRVRGTWHFVTAGSAGIPCK